MRVLAALLLTLVSSLCQGQAPPADLPVRLTLTLEGQPRKIAQVQWGVGHGELKIATGMADRVMAGKHPVGVFFTGEGSFRYTSAHAMEFPVFRRNAEGNPTPLSVNPRVPWQEGPGTLGFTAAVQEGLVLGMSGAFLEGLPAAEAMDKAFEAHRLRFLLGHQPGNHAPYHRAKEHLLAFASRNAPGKPAAMAEFLAGDHGLVYLYDQAWTRVEALDGVESFYHRQDRFQRYIPLSFQPLGWTLQDAPGPAFILQDVDLKLVAEKTGNTALRVQETIMPFQPLRYLSLNQLNHLRDGNQVERVRVTSVTDGAGKALAYSHREDRLLLDLGRMVPADAPVQLVFELEGRMLFNAQNFSSYKLGVEAWFPQPDWDGGFYTIRADLRVPKPDLPLAGGNTLRRWEEDGRNCLKVAFTQPVCNFTIYSGTYDLKEETRDGQTVRVATYKDMGSSAPKLLNLAFNIIDLYKPMLGPFPYKEFNVIQDRDFGWAQAPPGIMIITDEAFNGQKDDIAKMFTRGVNQRFAHEIAHQYWGNAVKATSWEEEWIQEAFAEYCSGEALRAVRSKGESAFESAIARWKSNAEFASAIAPIPLANRIMLMDDGLNMMLQRTALLYGKGPHLLQRIREQVGDPAFYRFLRATQAQFQGKFATTEDIRQILEAVTKKDFKAFFQAYYWGTALPPKGAAK